MARCLPKDAGLRALTPEQRWKCQPLKSKTGWIVSNLSPLCADALKRLCPGDSDMATRRTSILSGGPAIISGQAGRRQASKTNAAALKAAGGGSTRTAVSQSATGDLGGALGRQLGGETGEAIGTFIGDLAGRLIGGDRPHSGSGGQALTAPQGCPEGRILIRGQCVDLMALPPGGTPAVIPQPGTALQPGGQAVMGGFGLPAMRPRMETRVVRECGPGMVLGKDNLCYPKAILSRRSRFRKWRQPPRPPVTSGDVKAIRRAARAKDRVKDLAKDVGFSVKKR